MRHQFEASFQTDGLVVDFEELAQFSVRLFAGSGDYVVFFQLQMVADENIVFDEREVNFLFGDVFTDHILIVDLFPASFFELEFNLPSFYFEGLYLRFTAFCTSHFGFLNAL